MPSVVSLAAIVLAPYAIGLLIRHAALRKAATADEVWFPFSQRIQWLGLVNLAVWPSVYPPLAGPLIQEVLPPSIVTWSVLVMIVGMVLHILAVQMFVALCVQDVNRRVRGAVASAEPLSRGLAACAGAAFGVLCLLLAVTAMNRGDSLLAIGALVAGIVGMLLLARWTRPSTRWSPFAVTSGELRDRVFQLATRAGVTLNQLYVLPTARHRMANALAVQNQTVMITDYLLPHVTRDQLDAVMAHELAHLQRRHPTWLGVVLMAGMGATWPLAQWTGLPTMVTFGVVLFGFLALSRRFEYSADAGAVALGAQPEALIAGLVVVGRLNHVPARWSWLREWTLTHPSTERRALALAARAGLDPARVAELLETPGEPGTDRYALPAGASEDRVFSSAFKAAALARNGWTVVLANVVATVLLASLATGIGLTGVARWFAAIPVGLVVFAATYAVVQRSAMRPYRALRRPLCARLERMGFDPRGRETEMVGLAPGDRARFYEGFASWDVGFLWFRPDRLVYLGEETTFSLTRAEIDGLEPGAEFPGWIRARGTCLRWTRRDRSGAFTLQAVRAGGLISLAAETRRLTERIERWRAAGDGVGRVLSGVHTGMPPVPVPIGPPPTGEVTGVEPSAIVRPGAVAFTLVLHVVLVVVIGAIARLGIAPAVGLGVLDAMLASAIGYLLLIAPMLRRAPAGGAEEQREQRAA